MGIGTRAGYGSGSNGRRGGRPVVKENSVRMWEHYRIEKPP
jgi:hypothetical protein